jgi:hypothetical protein
MVSIVCPMLPSLIDVFDSSLCSRDGELQHNAHALSSFLPLDLTSRLSVTIAEHDALRRSLAHPPYGVSFLLLGGASG